MDKTIWIAITLFAGSLLPIQAGLNAKLSKAGESPIHASTISFIVGTLALMIYLTVTKQTVSWTGLKAAPAYMWGGGLIGAFYITVVLLAFPKLGPGLTFGLLVAGQMLFSLLLEHNNILVAQQQPISLGRIVGLLLIVAGVILMKKF